MPSTSHWSYDCHYIIVPGDVELFSISSPIVPAEGWFLDWKDYETQVVTRYRIQDIILDVEEIPAEPTPPPQVPPLPSPETRQSLSVRVEITIVP
jgi:hypothetical protein